VGCASGYQKGGTVLKSGYLSVVGLSSVKLVADCCKLSAGGDVSGRDPIMGHRPLLKPLYYVTAHSAPGRPTCMCSSSVWVNCIPVSKTVYGVVMGRGKEGSIVPFLL